MQNARNNWVWGMLLATLIVCAWLEFNASDTQDDELLPAKNSAKRLFTPELATSSNFTITQQNEHQKPLAIQLFREQIVDEPQSLFHAAYSSPVEDVPASNTATEQPLSLPFSYVGKLVAAGEITVFITDGSRHFSVQLHDTIDGVWQVTAIQPQIGRAHV